MAQSATKKEEIMYWRSDSGARADLIRSLEADGFTVKLAQRLEDVLDYLLRRTVAAVVVDASMSESETNSRALELSSTEKLFKVPLLYLSNGGKDACASLARQFDRFVSLTNGVDPREVLAQLDEIRQHKPGNAREGRPQNGPPGKTTEQIRMYFSHHLDPSRLVSSYGGTVFAFATRPGVFDDQYLVPQHAKREEITAMLKDLTQNDRLLGTHVRRVCYVGSALAHGAGFSKFQDEVVRATALLLNITLPGREDLITLDFLYDDIEGKAEELATAFGEAAALVQSSIADNAIVRSIQLVADILRRREMFDSTEQILSSQCVLLAELAGRACWKNGLWSSNGAHRVIRELRYEHRYSLDKALVGAMCRLISEASSARHASEPQTGKVISPEEADVQRLLVAEATKESAALFHKIEQADVDISDLRSGMRLAAPLITADGRLVLKSNVRLDQALIWSLWQLLAVAPIHRTLRIVKADEQSPESHEAI